LQDLHIFAAGVTGRVDKPAVPKDFVDQDLQSHKLPHLNNDKTKQTDRGIHSLLVAILNKKKNSFLFTVGLCSGSISNQRYPYVVSQREMAKNRSTIEVKYQS